MSGRQPWQGLAALLIGAAGAWMVAGVLLITPGLSLGVWITLGFTGVVFGFIAYVGALTLADKGDRGPPGDKGPKAQQETVKQGPVNFLLLVILLPVGAVLIVVAAIDTLILSVRHRLGGA